MPDRGGTGIIGAMKKILIGLVVLVVVVILAVGGYVLGTYAALVCAALLELVYGII